MVILQFPLLIVPESVLIVTPVWNDSTRLSEYGPRLARAFSQSSLPLRWVIADDGSGEEEVETLRKLQQEFQNTFPEVSLHLADGHRGKGSIIREAWDADADSTWLAFADCDGSVTAGDLLALIGKAVEGGESIIGIRKRTAETQITESAYRWIFHHGYLLVVRLLLGLQSEDLQCGAKIIRAADYRRVSPRLVEPGFPFDTELLSALLEEGCGWREVPVNWTEKKGGKVRPMSDAWKMFKAVLRIRRRRQ